jgi:hypothetical protein
MATYGTIQGTTKNSSGADRTANYGTWVSWSRNSYSIVNNTSNVTITISVQRIDGYVGETVWDLITKPSVSLSVGGIARTPTISYIDTRNHRVSTFATWTGDVSHNTDGTLNLGITCSWTLPSTPLASGYISGTATLDTIPRATTPTFSTTRTTMGNAITITINPASSTFKHKLRYVWSTLTHQIDGFSTDENFTAQGYISVTFTPPTSLANYIPSSNSGVCTVQCYTYDANGNHIGTVETGITLDVPSYTPTATLTITGNNLLSGAYVQGKSTMSVSIAASSSYGATITGYTSAVDGSTYTGNTFTTGTLSNGSKSVVTTITDSRGKTATITSAAHTVYAYTAPQITSFALERQPDGTTVIATVKGSISAVNNKNAKTIKVVLNGVTNTITSNAYTINGTTTFTNIPTDVTLIGTVTFTDSYVTTKQDSVLPTVAVTMDFLYDGTGIAMGKVAELPNTLDVVWKIKNDSVKTLLGGLGKDIAGGSNLNTINFITPGNYVCALNDTAKTLINSPTASAFKMSVYNCLDTWTDVQAASYMYIIREITNLDGNSWIQYVRKEGGDWYYAPWRLILDTGKCTDFVVEQGSWDGWEYAKWNSGKIEMYGEKWLQFPTGTQQGGYNLWRSIVSIDLSAWFTKIWSGTCSIQTNGMVPVVCRHSTNVATAEIVIVTSREIPAFGIAAPLYLVGKWK